MKLLWNPHDYGRPHLWNSHPIYNKSINHKNLKKSLIFSTVSWTLIQSPFQVPSGNQTWLAGKSPINGGLHRNHWWMVHFPCLMKPEGIVFHMHWWEILWQTMAKKRPRTVILHMNEMHGFHSILSSTCIVILPPWQIPANITPINCLPGKSGRLYLPDLPSSCKTIQRIPHEIVLYMTSIIWLVVEPPFCKILYSQLGLFEIYRKMKMVQTTKQLYSVIFYPNHLWLGQWRASSRRFLVERLGHGMTWCPPVMADDCELHSHPLTSIHIHSHPST